MSPPIVHFRGEIDGASIVVETTDERGPYGYVWRSSSFEGTAHPRENFQYPSAAVLDAIATWAPRRARAGLADLLVTMKDEDEEHVFAVYPDVYHGATRRPPCVRRALRGVAA